MKLIYEDEIKAEVLGGYRQDGSIGKLISDTKELAQGFRKKLIEAEISRYDFKSSKSRYPKNGNRYRLQRAFDFALVGDDTAYALNIDYVVTAVGMKVTYQDQRLQPEIKAQLTISTNREHGWGCWLREVESRLSNEDGSFTANRKFTISARDFLTIVKGMVQGCQNGPLICGAKYATSDGLGDVVLQRITADTEGAEAAHRETIQTLIASLLDNSGQN